MRRVTVLVIAFLFFSCLFREITVTKTFMLCLVMASAYALSKVKPRYVLASKYPVIGLCLAFSPVLVIYPALRSLQAAAAVAMLLAFYSIALFVATTEEKGRKVYKEVVGLSLLYGASTLNLVLTGHAELMLPLSISMLLFLFIIDRMKIVPVVAAYAAACTIFLAATGVFVFGGDLFFSDAARYTLIACAFCLLLMTFVSFLKRTDFVSFLAFFSLLYVSVDVLMSVGLKLNGILLHQPVLGLFVVGPLMGMVMKGGKERP